MNYATDEDPQSIPVGEEKEGGKDRGMRLVRALEQRALTLGMDAGDLAAHFGYTERYFNVLLKGDRWIGTVGYDKLAAMAKFLEYPLVTVYVLADILQLTDFLSEPNVHKRIEEGYERMSRTHPTAAWMPNKQTWDKAPVEVLLLCVTLHERLIFQHLEHQIDPPDRAQQEPNLR